MSDISWTSFSKSDFIPTITPSTFWDINPALDWTPMSEPSTPLRRPLSNIRPGKKYGKVHKNFKFLNPLNGRLLKLFSTCKITQQHQEQLSGCSNVLMTWFVLDFQINSNNFLLKYNPYSLGFLQENPGFIWFVF